jgi:Tfp pilus assembly protein FimT
MSKTNHQRLAFSYAEIIVIMTIISILLAVAKPRMDTYIERERVRSLTRRITVDLAMARAEAIKRRSPVTVNFDVTGQFYEIPELVNVNTLDGFQSNYKVDFSKNSEFNANIDTVDFGGATQVVFDAFGVPSNQGSIVITEGDTKGTIDLASATGRINSVLGINDVVLQGQGQGP